MKKNDGGTVYPHHLLRTGADESDLNYISTGISRRNWLAGLAMQGLLASEGVQDDLARLAERAYEMADTMIKVESDD